jgi:polyisoprenoid-binding protein YceI
MKTLNSKATTVSTYMSRLVAVVLTISLSAFVVTEQTSFKSVSGSQIKVNGTSNIHDWTMNATTFNCEGSYVVKGGQLEDITALSFTLPVTNLKGKEDLLNTRAHKALKAEEFNIITFKLTSATVVPQQKVIKATGNLTIAGVTKPVALQTTYTVNGDEVVCKGSKTLKMSEYGIKAPTFMMGALKVADEVTIDLSLKLKN